jgi:hypothetical protein
MLTFVNILKYSPAQVPINRTHKSPAPHTTTARELLELLPLLLLKLNSPELPRINTGLLSLTQLALTAHGKTPKFFPSFLIFKFCYVIIFTFLDIIVYINSTIISKYLLKTIFDFRHLYVRYCYSQTASLKLHNAVS